MMKNTMKPLHQTIQKTRTGRFSPRLLAGLLIVCLLALAACAANNPAETDRSPADASIGSAEPTKSTQSADSTQSAEPAQEKTDEAASPPRAGRRLLRQLCTGVAPFRRTADRHHPGRL